MLTRRTLLSFIAPGIAAAFALRWTKLPTDPKFEYRDGWIMKAEDY